METWILLIIFNSQPAVPISGYESRQACELARDVAKENKYVDGGMCFPGPKVVTFSQFGPMSPTTPQYLDRMPTTPMGPNLITPNNLIDPHVLIGPDCCKVYVPD